MDYRFSYRPPKCSYKTLFFEQLTKSIDTTVYSFDILIDFNINILSRGLETSKTSERLQ